MGLRFEIYTRVEMGLRFEIYTRVEMGGDRYCEVRSRGWGLFAVMVLRYETFTP